MKQHKKTTLNTVANLGAKVWAIVAGFVFVPFYIRFLGEDAYGLISFFTTLQSVLQLLGLSLSSSLRREFAAGERELQAARRHKYKMLRSVETLYGVIALIVIVFCWFGRYWIAAEWVNTTIPMEQVAQVIFLMGISIGLQIVSNLWYGCILGAGKQVLANGYYFLWTLCKNVGAVGIAFVFHDLNRFYLWHILCDMLYLVVLRLYLRRYLGPQEERWHLRDLINLKPILRYTSGLFFISIVALINKQMDKAILSRYFSLSELGAYNLAGQLGSTASMVPNAMASALFSDFTEAVTLQQRETIDRIYDRYTKYASALALCMGAFLAVFSRDLIWLWSGSETYANLIASAAPFLIMGYAMVSLQEIPYALALANGNTKINNLMGIFSLPVLVGLEWWFIPKTGVLGAGMIYGIVMSICTVVYLILIVKTYTTLSVSALLWRDLVGPLSVSLLSALAVRQFICQGIESLLLRCGAAVFFGGVTLLVLLHRDLRDIMNLLKK